MPVIHPRKWVCFEPGCVPIGSNKTKWYYYYNQMVIVVMEARMAAVKERSRSEKQWGGVPLKGDTLVQEIRTGFPFARFDELVSHIQMNKKELASRLRIPGSTLMRREKSGRFTSEESDRIYRLTKIIKASEDLFEGDTAAARDWLTRPAKALGGQCPIDMIATSAEAQMVEDLIGQIDHGVIA
ncbi:MAG: DUF2384 domain-containing protein [Halomonadaceae bacterium]|nr:MAG: DUF2384 domain-containing protein [Halomonadaceae bacterium]